jgi:hypothetical protein
MTTKKVTMRFSPGQDVLVDFEGKSHRGEVIRHSGGYVMCQILTDPEWDYGKQSAVLTPESTVCVREARVQLYEKENA